MNVDMLLDQLSLKGIRVKLKNGDLNVTAPKGQATSEDLATIAKHKTSIVSYFKEIEALKQRKEKGSSKYPKIFMTPSGQVEFSKEEWGLLVDYFRTLCRWQNQQGSITG